MLFRKSLKREDLDERQFSDEAQTYLAEIRGGCSEAEARARTKAEYPHLRDHHFVEWGQDEAFRGFMRDFQAIGAEARRWDAAMLEAQRTAGDPYATIPLRPVIDKAPGWQSRLVQRAEEVLAGEREHQFEDGLGTRFTPLTEMSPTDLATADAQHRPQAKDTQDGSRVVGNYIIPGPNPDSCPMPQQETQTATTGRRVGNYVLPGPNPDSFPMPKKH